MSQETIGIISTVLLRRKLKRVKDEKKKQIITKHLKRLTAPTERAAAVDCPEDFTQDRAQVVS